VNGDHCLQHAEFFMATGVMLYIVSGSNDRLLTPLLLLQNLRLSRWYTHTTLATAMHKLSI